LEKNACPEKGGAEKQFGSPKGNYPGSLKQALNGSTVKKIFFEKESIVLQPANHDHKPRVIRKGKKGCKITGLALWSFRRLTAS